MSNDIDQAFKRFQAIRAALVDALAQPINEADTRFKVLDRLLIEVFSWKHDSIRTEPSTAEGFIDYLLSIGDDRRVFVIEAKRSGSLKPGGTAQTTAGLLLGGVVLKPLNEAIKQALHYSTDEGVPYAAVTDGSCWVFFRASRTDGRRPMEGRGILFRGFDDIEKQFSLFYELIAPIALNQRRNVGHLNRAEGVSIADAEIQYYASEPKMAKMLRRQSLGSDAALIFEKFFGRLTDASNEEMLTECFVESPESVKADTELAKITENLLNSLVALDTGESVALQREVQRTISTQQSEVVLLVGNKGSGKSTFTKRFFKVVLPPNIRSQCAVVRIDLEGYHNVQDKVELSVWLLRETRDKLEKAVFFKRPPTASDWQGVFWEEYNRWKEAHKALYERDEKEFRVQFDAHIEKLRHNELDTYIKALLKRSSAGNKRLPCIIFDNTDQFSPQVQDHIYQYAHAISRHSPAFVLVPITDRTVWRLGKSGALQSYSAQSFYLPIPEAKKILSKRVSFIQSRLNAEPDAAKSYFTQKGFQISTKDLSIITDAVESVLIQQDFVSGLIGRLGNFDIRRMLQLAKRIFVSPEMRIEELVKSRFTGRPVTADRFRTYRALIKGEYDRFTEQNNDFVINLFRTDAQSPSSPLLAFYLLWLLRSQAGGQAEDNHLGVEEICNLFESCGSAFDGTLQTLQRLHDNGLIEEINPNIKTLGITHHVAIKDAGIGHMDLLQSSETYLEQMALATGVSERAVRDKLRSYLQPVSRTSFENIRKVFVKHVLDVDAARISFPPGLEYRVFKEARKRFEQLNQEKKIA